jgi:hypothetical protein
LKDDIDLDPTRIVFIDHVATHQARDAHRPLPLKNHHFASAASRSDRRARGERVR